MVRDVEPRNAERECYKRWHHCELKTDFDRDLELTRFGGQLTTWFVS